MKKQMFAILILAVIMIALPLHLRFAHKNPTLAGTEPYYHARMAVQLLDGIPKEDNSILGSREYVIEPYHAVLAVAYKIAGPLAFNLLPALFALASFVFFWLLLNTLKIPEPTQAWMLLAYALSPPLIAIGTIGTPHAFVLALILAGAWLLSTKWWLLGTASFIIASISGLTYTLSTITLLLIFYLTQKIETKKIMTALVPAIAVFIIGHYPPAIQPIQGMAQYLSDIGGTYGFSIFATLLAIVGAILAWEHKKTYYGAYVLAAVFLAACFFIPGLLVFANVFVSGLAGVALAKLAQKKWELSFLRQAGLLVLFCGLLFSSISHAVSIADTPPTQSFFKALEFQPSTILTHENYGFWIESAGHTAVMDPYWKHLPDAEDRSWDVAAIFSSVELDKTTKLMKKYNITHALITSEMEHGLVWEREDQGLEFIVENSETFKKLETGSNIGVWSAQ